jgi:phage terminase large subunit-like protein
LWLRRKWKVRSWEDIPFEAEMPEDQMFQGFNLSEIHAAQAVASRANGGPSGPV